MSSSEKDHNSESMSEEEGEDESSTFPLSLKDIIEKLGIDPTSSEPMELDELKIFKEHPEQPLQSNSELSTRDFDEWNDILLKNNKSLYLLAAKIKELRSFLDKNVSDTKEVMFFY